MNILALSPWMPIGLGTPSTAGSASHANSRSTHSRLRVHLRNNMLESSRSCSCKIRKIHGRDKVEVSF
ncbi:conserved hypothetical protein [Ricinus communis]|uniref:Uncharacterized protein n=1 Tax=Ricinus communis TaxID=3988 RepID=B9S870_RICCO|nr:conserved hypothetical protein [Ricinus communis]